MTKATERQRILLVRLLTESLEHYSTPRALRGRAPVNFVALGIGFGLLALALWGKLTEHGPPNLWGLVLALVFIELLVGFGRLTWHRSYPFLRYPPRRETPRPDLMTRQIEGAVKALDTSADEMRTDGEPSLRTTKIL